jgi:hypothetical protein
MNRWPRSIRWQLDRPLYPTIRAGVVVATLAALSVAVSGIWWWVVPAAACGALIAVLVRHVHRDGDL